MKKLLIPLVCVGLAVGCGDTPTGTDATGTDGLTPKLAAAGKSGCSTVNFRVVFTALSPVEFTGVVTGDLVGTNYSVFDLSTHVVRGVKTRVKATVEWWVTHEDMGDLHFITLANGGMTADPNDPNVVTLHSTERALSGVRIANLHDSGTFTATGALLEYGGVICP